MKKLFMLLIALGIVISFSGAAFAGYKSEYKMSVVVGPNTPWGMAAKKFADLVKERSGGKINIKIFYGGQLFAGKQTNEFLLLKTGVADFALGSTINWSPQVPVLNLFSLPFFFKDYKELDRVENGKAGEMIFKTIDRLGVVGLAWGENGFRELTNSKHPVKTPADLEGLKIRVVGSKIFVDTFKALGANPVIMNWGDAVTAFQQRVVDGQENPIVSVIIPYKVYEYHKYLTVWHYTIDPLILGVSKRTWNSFSQKDKEIIRKAAIEACEIEKAMVRAGLDDGTAMKYLKKKGIKPFVENPFEFLKSKGVKITILTPAELAKFKAKCKSVYDKWEKRIGKKVIEAAEKDKLGK